MAGSAISPAPARARRRTPSSGLPRGSAARVELADVELAPRGLECAARDRTLLDFRVHRPSLHDAFLALTGHAPRD